MTDFRKAWSFGPLCLASPLAASLPAFVLVLEHRSYLLVRAVPLSGTPHFASQSFATAGAPSPARLTSPRLTALLLAHSFSRSQRLGLLFGTALLRPGLSCVLSLRPLSRSQRPGPLFGTALLRHGLRLFTGPPFQSFETAGAFRRHGLTSPGLSCVSSAGPFHLSLLWSHPHRCQVGCTESSYLGVPCTRLIHHCFSPPRQLRMLACGSPLVGCPDRFAFGSLSAFPEFSRYSRLLSSAR